MKHKLTILILGLLVSQILFGKAGHVDDVYIVFYATSKGKTGHIGIAVDNYKIIYKEVKTGDKIIEVEDTITTGELTYYDLWPDDDHFRVTQTGKDIPAVYYKLPVTTTDEITLNSLYDKGIPHKEHYPSDGLLKINTSWQQDQWLIHFLDSTITADRAFNARKFNCSDFVRIPLERLLNTELKSREFVLAGWSTTPNKLYRRLRQIEEVEVVKNADEKATRSFIGQRVIYKILHRSKSSS
jgi:hypothetical protein